MIFYFLLFLLIIDYSFFLLWCCLKWLRIKNTSEEPLTKPAIQVAVIIPVRNESMKLSQMIKALSNQDYQKEYFEILVVDDHSEDDTIQLAEDFFRENNLTNASCFSNQGYSKKSAISYGISQSNAELILTTDADVIPQKQWISSIVHHFKTSGSVFIAGPVKLKGSKNIFEIIQCAEFSGLIGIGAASIRSRSPIMCNGANLAFTRKVFDEVGGYDESKSISGDDTQLMLKVHQKYPKRISFLKDKRAIVQTNVSSGADFLNQRKRWASKIITTLSPLAIWIAFVSWLVHLTLLIVFIRSIILGNYLMLLLLSIIKIIPEIIFLKMIGNFFKEKYPMLLVILIQPIYWFYISLIGLISPFGKYKWKGRVGK